MAATGSFYAEQLRRVIAEEDWLVAVDALRPGTRFATVLQELGARSVRVLASSRGTGEPIGEFTCRVLDVRAASMMEGIRASEAALDDPPDGVLRWLDSWDPDRRARVLRPLFSVGRSIGGRATWGAREVRWQALEDKTVVDALWDAAGVARAPSRVVPVEAAALAVASQALDRGSGTVWAGDNTSGWHGGASYTRWVETRAEAAEALDLLAGACATARVMPFIEGVPCSIHGIVFPDDVRALRPCEMVVLRGTGRRKLAYAAASTTWDPAPADREVMRDTARRVGWYLKDRMDYRGVFTIDGVMGADGFIPTELNPRFGAAIGVMTRSIPGLPMYLLHCALVAGEELDWRPAELERLILDAADAHREGRAALVSSVRREEEVGVGLVWTEAGVREAQEGEDPHASLMLGPAVAGSYLHVNFVTGHTPVGPSLGSRAAEALSWADERYALELGPLTGAPSVR